MAEPTQIILHSAVVRRLLNSAGVKRDLTARAVAIARAAGSGNVAIPAHDGKQRARAAVVTYSDEAKSAEAIDHALTRAIDAGR